MKEGDEVKAVVKLKAGYCHEIIGSVFAVDEDVVIIRVKSVYAFHPAHRENGCFLASRRHLVCVSESEVVK